MGKQLTITKKRQIIGTLIILFAIIQIINFANRQLDSIPSLYYKYEQFKGRSILEVLTGNLNYPFKWINYSIYYLFGWAGLLSPFFFIVLGYTFFQRRTEKLKRIRVLLLWGLAEITLLIYVSTYISSFFLPQHVKPGELAKVFSKYLMKLGGVSFILLFFFWSLGAYLIFLKRSSWKKMFRSFSQLLWKAVYTLSTLLGQLLTTRKKPRPSVKMINNRKSPGVFPRQQAEKSHAHKDAQTALDQGSSTITQETGKLTHSRIQINSGDVIEAEYAVYKTRESDSTELPFSFPYNALHSNIEADISAEETKTLGDKIKEVFRSFGITLNQTGLTIGPQLFRFEYVIPSGLQLKEIEKYKHDLSYRIGGRKVTIQTPIPGTNSFGINIQRLHSDLLNLGSYLKFIMDKNASVPLLMGVSPDGKELWADGADFPHLLIAGATGSGKSVFLNSLIINLLAVSNRTPINMILIDPKRVEFTPYKDLPQLASPILVNVSDAQSMLVDCENLMELRYDKLSKNSVRNSREYNQKGTRSLMPYLFIIIDEFSDLILQDEGSSIKNSIIRLAQKSRAVGIHLILATQRPSADIIDGLIKANFPSRIAFKTSSQIDSRIILDENGAESLLGKGDMLYKGPGGENHRLQGLYVGLDEIKRVVSEFQKHPL